MLDATVLVASEVVAAVLVTGHSHCIGLSEDRDTGCDADTRCNTRLPAIPTPLDRGRPSPSPSRGHRGLSVLGGVLTTEVPNVRRCVDRCGEIRLWIVARFGTLQVSVKSLFKRRWGDSLSGAF